MKSINRLCRREGSSYDIFFFPRDGKNERTLKKKKERKGKKKHLCELAIEITLSTPVHVCAAPGRVHHNTVFLYLRKFY